MKTKLLKRLRSEARRKYYIEATLNKLEWDIKLIQVIYGLRTTTLTLESHHGTAHQRDKYEFMMNNLKYRCDQERRKYILIQISTKRCKQTKTRIVY